MKRSLVLGAVVGALTLASPASAITYVLNQTIGSGSAVGTITTDNTLGVLGGSNITGFSITLNDGSGTFVINQGNAGLGILGSALTATATGLFFNFSAAGGNYLLFQNPSQGSGINYFCLQTSGCYTPTNVPGMGVRVQGTIQNVALQGNVQFASVTGGAVPEPATWAMMLAGFGALGFAMRRRPQVTTRVRFA